MDSAVVESADMSACDAEVDAADFDIGHLLGFHDGVAHIFLGHGRVADFAFAHAAGFGLAEADDIEVAFGVQVADDGQAQVHFEQCLALARSIKHQELESECERNLGELALPELAGDGVRFCVDAVPFRVPMPGRHNAENAVQAVRLCERVGVPLATSAASRAAFLAGCSKA